MQIKIEIDVKPEELRRFLGLPDVTGLQDDIIGFLRDKVGAASEFDATGFVKTNLDALRKTPAWKNLVARVMTAEHENAQEPSAAGAAPRKARKSRRSGKATAA